MLNSPISIVQFSRYLKGIIPIFASLLNLTHFDYYLPMMYCAQSCPTLCDPIGCSLPGPSVHGYSPGKNTGVGCHFLLQGIFQIQGLNPGLLHCRWILYQMNQKGNPRTLAWVAYHFASGSSQPRNRTRVSSIAGVLFTN